MSKNLDGETHDRLVIWLRRRMAESGITPDALAASIEADTAQPPLYRDALGNDWNGKGNMPEWLAAAKHAGVDPDFFRVSSDRGDPGTAYDPRSMAFFLKRDA